MKNFLGLVVCTFTAAVWMQRSMSYLEKMAFRRIVLPKSDTIGTMLLELGSVRISEKMAFSSRSRRMSFLG